MLLQWFQGVGSRVFFFQRTGGFTISTVMARNASYLLVIVSQ